MKLKKFITLVFEKEDRNYLLEVIDRQLLGRDKGKLTLDEVHHIANQADLDSIAFIIALLERRCRNCGCTQADCSQCIEKTGAPCTWVSEDLCSACYKPKRTNKKP